jgi:hypothetical protein
MWRSRQRGIAPRFDFAHRENFVRVEPKNKQSSKIFEEVLTFGFTPREKNVRIEIKTKARNEFFGATEIKNNFPQEIRDERCVEKNIFTSSLTGELPCVF